MATTRTPKTQNFNFSIIRVGPPSPNPTRWEVKLDGKRVGFVVKADDGYEPRSHDDGSPLFRNVMGDKVQAAFACVALFGEGA